MTEEEINARRPADKLAHPERYCRQPGCLLFAVYVDGYCSRHETIDGRRRTPREILEERCPPRE